MIGWPSAYVLRWGASKSLMSAEFPLAKIAELLTGEWTRFQDLCPALRSLRPNELNHMELEELEGVLEQARQAVVDQYGSVCSPEERGSPPFVQDEQRRASVAAAGAMNICGIILLPKGTPASDSAMYRATVELGLDQSQDAKMMQCAFGMLSAMAEGHAYALDEITLEFQTRMNIGELPSRVVTRAFLERYEKHVLLS